MVQKCQSRTRPSWKGLVLGSAALSSGSKLFLRTWEEAAQGWPSGGSGLASHAPASGSASPLGGKR